MKKSGKLNQSKSDRSNTLESRAKSAGASAFALKGRPDPRNHYAVLPYLVESGLEANKGMALFVRWARNDPKIGKEPLWDEVVCMDWSGAVSKVSGWTAAALKKLPKHPEVNFISILLGDSPEAFWIQGHPWAGGRSEWAKRVAGVRKLTYVESEAGDWDRMFDLGYYRTETLPGKVWKRQPFADPDDDNEDNELPFDAAFALWDAISHLGGG